MYQYLALEPVAAKVTYFELLDVKYLAGSIFIWILHRKGHRDKGFFA